MKKIHCEHLHKTVSIVQTMNLSGSVTETCLEKDKKTCKDCRFKENLHIKETKKGRSPGFFTLE